MRYWERILSNRRARETQRKREIQEEKDFQRHQLMLRFEEVYLQLYKTSPPVQFKGGFFCVALCEHWGKYREEKFRLLIKQLEALVHEREIEE